MRQRQPLNWFELCATGHTCCTSNIGNRSAIKNWKFIRRTWHTRHKWPNGGKRKPMSKISSGLSAQVQGVRHKQETSAREPAIMQLPPMRFMYLFFTSSSSSSGWRTNSVHHFRRMDTETSVPKSVNNSIATRAEWKFFDRAECHRVRVQFRAVAMSTHREIEHNFLCRVRHSLDWL